MRILQEYKIAGIWEFFFSPSFTHFFFFLAVYEKEKESGEKSEKEWVQKILRKKTFFRRYPPSGGYICYKGTHGYLLFLAVISTLHYTIWLYESATFTRPDVVIEWSSTLEEKVATLTAPDDGRIPWIKWKIEDWMVVWNEFSHLASLKSYYYPTAAPTIYFPCHLNEKKARLKWMPFSNSLK